MPKQLTEDQVRELANKTLGFNNSDDVIAGVGQLTTFNELGKALEILEWKGIKDKPDGWYLPKITSHPALVLETKNSEISIEKYIDELLKNCHIILKKYPDVIGIIYNGFDLKVFKNDSNGNMVEINTSTKLENKDYYLKIFSSSPVDKNEIYKHTRKINNLLHTEFGIKNLYHRMIFTACALVAKRYDAWIKEGMSYSLLHNSILNTLNKSLEKDIQQNSKLSTLTEVYSEIKMNSTENQEAINQFISAIDKISDSINSDNWRGEDVMGIFFNEFNRYKKKSESGQVFTPEHITSLMYRLIDVNKDSVVLDGACGSGGFLTKAMSNMLQEAGGPNSRDAESIKKSQLYGIEFDREIFALACANMLIHKDGKTNILLGDTRTSEAGDWIKKISYQFDEKNNIFLKDVNNHLIPTAHPVTKVLMNPPFERKYGCIDIVYNVLSNSPKGILAAFILPDHKLEKEKKTVVKKIFKGNKLLKIIKLPEETFAEGVSTSIFVFKVGEPQNGEEIFTCYIDYDGLETVKNQGRQDIKDRWSSIEDNWIRIIKRQTGDNSIQWITPDLDNMTGLSYPMPEKLLLLSEEDFIKTLMDFQMYKEEIDLKSFKENISNVILYSGELSADAENIQIKIVKDSDKND